MKGKIFISLKSVSGSSVKYLSGPSDMSKVRSERLAYIGE